MTDEQRSKLQLEFCELTSIVGMLIPEKGIILTVEINRKCPRLIFPNMWDGALMTVNPEIIRKLVNDRLDAINKEVLNATQS